MSNNWVSDIENMHDKFNVSLDILDKDKIKDYYDFRVSMIEEEFQELKDAKNSHEAVDAIIDLCVFAIGTLDVFSVDSNLAWNKVLKANMDKESGVKLERPNPFGFPDMIKPEGWEEPIHLHTGKLGSVFDEE